MAARKQTTVTAKKAVAAIEQHHALLVFPVDNAADPPSLWTHFFPRSPLRWVWDEAGDGRVWSLWHIRAELSRSRQVVYTKWYRDRPALFSPSLVAALLASLGTPSAGLTRLSSEARMILETLEDNSPQSPREIKDATDLAGRANERAYTRALRELWQRFLIVGYGEIQDGAFPSLAMGATRILFEDLWNEALSLDPTDATAHVRAAFADSPRLLRHFEQVRRAILAPPAP